MTASAAALEHLRRQRPEWAPWLAVIEAVDGEVAARRWDDAVPSPDPSPQPAPPLLTGVTLTLDAPRVRRLFERLIRAASRESTPKMRTLESALTARLDPLAVFAAALCHDSTRLVEVAATCGSDAEAFQAVAALVPVPFLQACHRRLTSSIAASWTKGYCPVCASWPAFAEVRGIERSRHFRCGRCGSEWHARALCCPYCSLRDHEELVTLVPGKSDSHAVIDACRRCLGYVKTFTRLQGCPPEAVMLDDLSSVALDVAALEQGYTRPPGAGCPLGISVAAASPRRRFLAWS